MAKQYARGKNPKSLGNLDPQANSKGGRSRKVLYLSDDAIAGAEEMAKRLGLLRGEKPNFSGAVNYILETVHLLALPDGDQLTIDNAGDRPLTSEKTNEP